MVGTASQGRHVVSAQNSHSQRAASQGPISEAKARQATRIKELGAALAAAGLATLDDQARALGLSRSTTWAVLKGNHKASGLSTATISRMLFSPELPPHVRATLLMYVEERAAGLFGHNEQQLRRFALSFCSSIREVFSRAPCTSSELFQLRRELADVDRQIVEGVANIAK
jgi:hypothetical protein